MGLLLIQDDAGSNEGNKERTKIEQEVVELNQVLALRDQELEEHEAELASLRAELQQFYEERASREGKVLSKPAQTGTNGAAATKVPGIIAKGQVAPNGLMPGSGQRIQWGKPNHVGHFTKGSSPREFGNKNRHEQLKEQVMGPDKLTGDAADAGSAADEVTQHVRGVHTIRSGDVPRRRTRSWWSSWRGEGTRDGGRMIGGPGVVGHTRRRAVGGSQVSRVQLCGLS